MDFRTKAYSGAGGRFQDRDRLWGSGGLRGRGILHREFVLPVGFGLPVGLSLEVMVSVKVSVKIKVSLKVGGWLLCKGLPKGLGMVSRLRAALRTGHS